MISLIKSTFYKEEEVTRDLINFLREAKKLSMGEQCLLFEKKLASWQGRKESVLVNSGSSANLALLQALLNLGRLKRGDRVGFSSLTWATNVMPIIQLGLIPVPIDVEIETLNVSSKKLLDVTEEVFGSKIQCLFITNLLGLCDDLDVIKEICDKQGIILIEDNCESMGSVYQGVNLGNFGIASTFSFYVGHHLSTIEGGAVMTNDRQLADMLRMVIAHGWKRDIDVKLDFYERYTFYDLGYNLRPTEITGLLGVVGIKHLDEIVSRREANANLLSFIYDSLRVYKLRSSHLDRYSSFSTPIVCKTEADKLKIVKKCDQLDIESRPIVGGNITQQPFFKKYVGEISCPNAEIIHRNGLYVANNPELDVEEIETIGKALWLK